MCIYRLDPNGKMVMPDDLIKSHKKRKVTLPPKRGQVKVRIVCCIAKTLAKLVSK